MKRGNPIRFTPNFQNRLWYTTSQRALNAKFFSTKNETHSFVPLWETLQIILMNYLTYYKTFGKLCHTYLYHQYWQPTLKSRIVFILVIYYPAAYHLVVAFNNPWLINQFRIVLYLPKNTINATKWRWRYHRALSLFLSSSWSMPWYWDFLSINFNINQLAIVLFKLDKNMLKRS